MRQDQWSATLTIDGRSFGVWMSLSGGDVEASETKIRPGGMRPELSLGGVATTNNVTLTKVLDRADYDAMRIMMAGRVGKARCVASRQPLDADGNPWGRPIIYAGVLQNVTPGDYDANSTDAQVWEVTISTEGSIG